MPSQRCASPRSAAPGAIRGTRPDLLDPLKAPQRALAVATAHAVERKRLSDARIEGALMLRLLQKHVHIERQCGRPTPDLPPPSTDELVARMVAARQRVGDLTWSVARDPSAATIDTLRALADAKVDEQEADKAPTTRAQTPPAPTAGGGLPATPKLQALLLAERADDCSNLSRALLGEHVGLSAEHEAVREEAVAVIDRLIDAGSGWQAQLKQKLVNRKRTELKKLKPDEKARKLEQLQRWARKTLLTRLVDDTVLLVEQLLAQRSSAT